MIRASKLCSVKLQLSLDFWLSQNSSLPCVLEPLLINHDYALLNHKKGVSSANKGQRQWQPKVEVIVTKCLEQKTLRMMNSFMVRLDYRKIRNSDSALNQRPFRAESAPNYGIAKLHSEILNQCCFGAELDLNSENTKLAPKRLWIPNYTLVWPDHKHCQNSDLIWYWISAISAPI